MPSSQLPSIAGVATDPTSLRQPIDDAEIVHARPGELRATIDGIRATGHAMLLDIGGVDYPARTPRFDVVYHLLVFTALGPTVSDVGTPRRVRVLSGVGGDAPSLPTLCDLWPNADWAEREIYDLFGIRFDGHPDLRRIQMPQDWQGHPLRKDYPLRGPAREATPRPAFALKSNVPAGAPPSGKTAAALQRQIARARGQQDDAS